VRLLKAKAVNEVHAEHDWTTRAAETRCADLLLTW